MISVSVLRDKIINLRDDTNDDVQVLADLSLSKSSSLILEYLKDLSTTLKKLSSNDSEVIKKQLNDKLRATEVFELRALKKIEQ